MQTQQRLFISRSRIFRPGRLFVPIRPRLRTIQRHDSCHGKMVRSPRRRHRRGRIRHPIPNRLEHAIQSSLLQTILIPIGSRRRRHEHPRKRNDLRLDRQHAALEFQWIGSIRQMDNTLWMDLESNHTGFHTLGQLRTIAEHPERGVLQSDDSLRQRRLGGIRRKSLRYHTDHRSQSRGRIGHYHRCPNRCIYRGHFGIRGDIGT
mmetsp:Transcript_12543/g.26508  ORF Transcript_12543/g.26508 Transcript_12543/m.26508 type:complete len:205 (-) Transcript_12543:899-1513(-)